MARCGRVFRPPAPVQRDPLDAASAPTHPLILETIVSAQAVELSTTGNEIWLPAPGLEGRYEVSNLGRARHVSGRLRKPKVRDGYRFLTYCHNRQTRNAPIARLVCIAFHGVAPKGHEVDHIDMDRGNDTASNLQWLTKSENLAKRQFSQGEAHYAAVLTAEQVTEIRASENVGAAEFAARFGVSRRTVRGIQSHQTWRSL